MASFLRRKSSAATSGNLGVSWGQVNSPAVPFYGNIKEGMAGGKMVFLQGFCSPESQGFLFVLRCIRNKMEASGSDEEDSLTPLEFEVNYTEGIVTRRNGGAGQNKTEESHGAFPFNLGQIFYLTVMATDSLFKVSINGEFFCDFPNIQEDLAEINFCEVTGDLYIISIDARGGVPPSYGLPMAPPLYSLLVNSFIKPEVPFTAKIPLGLYPGRMIMINGMPTTTKRGPPKSFEINLKCSSGSDVALYIKPHLEEQDVVVNAKIGRDWQHAKKRVFDGGKEVANAASTANAADRRGSMIPSEMTTVRRGSTAMANEDPNYPFKLDKEFSLVIFCEPDGFKVGINGHHFVSYSHRLRPLSRVDTVTIDGDVSVFVIRFQ